jgi:holdfast attachment protein HfaA
MTVRSASLAGALALVALAPTLASTAGAQSLSTSAAQFNAGWGQAYGQENQPANPTLRDANGNIVIVDGVIMHGQSTLELSGASAFASGAGSFSSSSSSTVSNVVVLTQGNWKTVILGAAPQAGTDFSTVGELNGKIDLNGPN